MENGAIRDGPGPALEQGDGGCVAVHRGAVEQAIDVGVGLIELLRQRRARGLGPEWIAMGAPIAVAKGPVRSSRVRSAARLNPLSTGSRAWRSIRRVAWKTSARQVGMASRAGGQIHDAPVLDLRPPLPVRQLVIESAGGRAVAAKGVPGCRIFTVHKSTAGPWWCLPVSDAAQAGWPAGLPRPAVRGTWPSDLAGRDDDNLRRMAGQEPLVGAQGAI